eukprot:jgi/Mesvir1/2027/Mv11892-RA.1
MQRGGTSTTGADVDHCQIVQVLRTQVEFWKAQAQAQARRGFKALRARAEELRCSQARASTAEDALIETRAQLAGWKDRAGESERQLAKTGEMLKELQQKWAKVSETSRAKEGQQENSQSRADAAEQALPEKEGQLGGWQARAAYLDCQLTEPQGTLKELQLKWDKVSEEPGNLAAAMELQRSHASADALEEKLQQYTAGAEAAEAAVAEKDKALADWDAQLVINQQARGGELEEQQLQASADTAASAWTEKEKALEERAQVSQARAEAAEAAFAEKKLHLSGVQGRAVALESQLVESQRIVREKRAEVSIQG